MFEEKYAVRVLLRHYWKAGLSVRAATDKICSIEGIGSMNKSTAGEWFKRFTQGDTSLEDKPRSGRPTTLENDALCAALKNQPSSSTRDLEAVMGVGKSTIHRHLHDLNFVHKKPRQVPHELTELQAKRRVEICEELLDNPHSDQFWKRIVTSDEKWIHLINHNRQKRWVLYDQAPPPVPCQERFGKKVMLCVWWNFQGIIHYEFVPNGRAIDAVLYCEQVERVYDKLKEKYPALIRRKCALLQQDNAKPHTAKKTKEKFEELDGVEILPHPPFSPDLAPSDYGLFRSMQHFFRGRRFENFDEVQEACEEFFNSKPRSWFFNQIRQLAERWQKVVHNDGLYFDE